MIDVLKNVSKITTIPRTQLDDVMHKVSMCIAHEVIPLVDDDNNGNQVDLDIGIGTLQLRHTEDDSISYKFIPSNQLEKMIISAVKSGESPIIGVCEQKIVERVLTTYKELL